MTGFKLVKSIYRMSRTLLTGGSTGLPAIAGTYEATLSYIATPTELGGWLGHVFAPPHHTARAPIIATLAPVWYHYKAMDP